jgi:PhnB protein
MLVQPYLFFDGRCQEALDFYRKTLGAEVTMLTHFKDGPKPTAQASADCPDAGSIPGDKVMHAQFQVGETTILASDGRCQGRPEFKGFSLSITVPNDEMARRLFNALAESGGQIQMPMEKTFFSTSFGMVADRFGVSWMVYVAPMK